MIVKCTLQVQRVAFSADRELHSHVHQRVLLHRWCYKHVDNTFSLQARCLSRLAANTGKLVNQQDTQRMASGMHLKGCRLSQSHLQGHIAVTSILLRQRPSSSTLQPPMQLLACAVAVIAAGSSRCAAFESPAIMRA